MILRYFLERLARMVAIMGSGLADAAVSVEDRRETEVTGELCRNCTCRFYVEAGRQAYSLGAFEMLARIEAAA